MNTFLQILKSVGLSVLIASVLGVIIGFISQFVKADHPHQIIPTWLLYTMLMFVVNLGISIIV